MTLSSLERDAPGCCWRSCSRAKTTSFSASIARSFQATPFQRISCGRERPDEMNRRVTSAAVNARGRASLKAAALLWRSPLLFPLLYQQGRHQHLYGPQALT
jgi:hypothetical protein